MRVVVVDDHRFAAMGTECHVQVAGGPPSACDVAEAIVRADEARWSRFLATSELSRINDGELSERLASDETRELLGLARALERSTGGWFDPWVGRAVIDAGYDRTFAQLSARAVADRPPTRRHPAGAERLLDLGGIAKGHTADRVHDALLASGAAGVCVNIGGDLRCGGEPPDGAWSVSVDHRPGATLGLASGGVATSTTSRRRWRTASGGAHHLVDPTTGRPSRTAVTSATVVASSAALAEALAKVVVLAPSEEARSTLARHGAVAVATCADGEVRHFGEIARFLHDDVGAGGAR